MQIFIDPATNQVMAVYKGCRVADPAVWTAQGFVEKEAPDNMPSSRDLKVVLDKDGVVTRWNAAQNPVRPVSRTRAKSRIEKIAEVLIAKGLVTEEEIVNYNGR